MRPRKGKKDMRKKPVNPQKPSAVIRKKQTEAGRRASIPPPLPPGDGGDFHSTEGPSPPVIKSPSLMVEKWKRNTGFYASLYEGASSVMNEYIQRRAAEMLQAQKDFLRKYLQRMAGYKEDLRRLELKIMEEGNRAPEASHLRMAEYMEDFLRLKRQVMEEENRVPDLRMTGGY